MRRSARVCFGDVTYGPGGICGPRIQSDFQFIAIVTGSATVEIDGTTVPLPQGHGLLLRPGRREKISFDRDRPTRHTWCAVHPTLLDAALDEALSRTHSFHLADLPPTTAPLSDPPAARPHRVSTSLQRLMESGLKAPLRTTFPGPGGMLDHLGLALLALCVDWEGAEPAEVEPDPVRKTRELIDRRYPEPLRLSDLARAAGTTGNHLIRLFKRHTGITPTRYLWQVRTREGIERLTRTGLSVSEIADRCGFANPFHFSRLVRRTTGQSPRALRNEAWSDPSDLRFQKTP